MGSCYLISTDFQIWKVKQVLEIGCATVGIYQCYCTIHLKMAEILKFVMCIFYNKKIQPQNVDHHDRILKEDVFWNHSLMENKGVELHMFYLFNFYCIFSLPFNPLIPLSSLKSPSCCPRPWDLFFSAWSLYHLTSPLQ